MKNLEMLKHVPIEGIKTCPYCGEVHEEHEGASVAYSDGMCLITCAFCEKDYVSYLPIGDEVTYGWIVTSPTHSAEGDLNDDRLYKLFLSLDKAVAYAKALVKMDNSDNPKYNPEHTDVCEHMYDFYKGDFKYVWNEEHSRTMYNIRKVRVDLR